MIPYSAEVHLKNRFNERLRRICSSMWLTRWKSHRSFLSARVPLALSFHTPLPLTPHSTCTPYSMRLKVCVTFGKVPHAAVYRSLVAYRNEVGTRYVSVYLVIHKTVEYDENLQKLRSEYCLCCLILLKLFSYMYIRITRLLSKYIRLILEYILS